MTLVYLLRHGATAANRCAPYRLQGRGTDLPLDAVGQAQSLRAAEALAGRGVQAVYCSPLLRARQTAAAIAGHAGLAAVAVPELTEADIGSWEGLTWDEVRARDPDRLARFLAAPGTEPYPGGESFLDAQRRVAPVLEALASAHPDGRIAVVGHNITNRAYLALLLGLPIDRARALRQANGGINVLHLAGPDAHVITLNAALHLDGLKTAE